LLHGILADVLARDVTRKEPLLGPFHSPPVTQDFQQLRRQHHVAILLTLALIDANHHPRAVNVPYGEANRFRDAQARRVARGQDRAMLGAADAVEELEDFFRAQDNGQCLRFLGRRDDVFKGPVLLQGDLVEKSNSVFRTSPQTAW
jgi:hypothetical protein